jgi:hypothetical protein
MHVSAGDSVDAQKMNQPRYLYQAIGIFNFAIAKRYADDGEKLILRIILDARLEYTVAMSVCD